MEGPISFWGYKEQESTLILPEHDDDDDDELTHTIVWDILYLSEHFRQTPTNGLKISNTVNHILKLFILWICLTL